MGVVLASLAEVAEEEIAVIKTHQGGGVRAITWEVLKEETAKSHVCRRLLQLIGTGLPTRREDWPQDLIDYHRYKNQLLEIDGVVVCGERPLIPASLRSQALDILHAGHAGTNMMQSRSSQSLFWPGMTREIEERRARCKDCIFRAPSQAALPSQPPIAPDYPFSYICADFFAVNGRTYQLWWIVSVTGCQWRGSPKMTPGQSLDSSGATFHDTGSRKKSLRMDKRL